MHARRRQRVHLLRGGALSIGDNGASVAHPPSRRRSLPSDESYHRLLEATPDVGGHFLFSCPTDLTDHNDGIGLIVTGKQLKSIHERRADERVTADADTGAQA